MSDSDLATEIKWLIKEVTEVKEMLKAGEEQKNRLIAKNAEAITNIQLFQAGVKGQVAGISAVIAGITGLLMKAFL